MQGADSLQAMEPPALLVATARRDGGLLFLVFISILLICPISKGFMARGRGWARWTRGLGVPGMF